ncbi:MULTISPECIES: adaptor protein MecA [Psychrobacillus]|uniref:Adapter protein MecA n=1 Tax=Psychrobacillus faecigallinarum TaxID=2762235 RepID=A0ABR8R5B4_9BACI|nr:MULTISPECIES: adaptor protein MecA [Psychrobacillus]MBD7942955.1 adaptor protein MecA [Psychrobacillus faecigallinarum]QEY20416.1 adaptor protein MecA [Psychrobacillus sp. AK 1817]QGM30951.1 adaptor protein MecA [Bacillus sp. N3536]
MDIERINDNTFKVYISYIDIEERGFSRDEIWFNKDKSEQLFWEMMDEVHDDDHFEELDGPLWIQVHAMEKGLEVIVTRTEMAKDEQSDDSLRSEDLSNKIFKNAVSNMGPHEFDDFSNYMDDLDEIPSEYTFVFENFEDVIGLSKKLEDLDFDTSLYHYNEKYYLHVAFDMDLVELEAILNTLSVISEFGQSTKTTIHIIQEYGKEIIANNVMEELNRHF